MTSPANHIDHLSWDEVQAHLGTNDAVIVPIGSVEPHGRHAPLGTDTFIAAEIADRLAAETGSLVFPALHLGALNIVYDFRGHPGGVAIDPGVLIDLYTEVGIGLARAGFRRIVFANAHGPNSPLLAVAAYRIRDAAEVEVGVLEWWAVASDEVKAFKGVTHGTHADQVETSLLLATANGSDVRLERAVPQQDRPTLSPAQERLYHLKVTFTRTWDDRWVGDSANMGDPTKARVEPGDRILAQVTEVGVTLLEALAEELARTRSRAP